MTTLIDGTFNSRDTGGLPLAGGGRTRHGVLYRSDALSSATDGGLDAIAASTIGTIVDFRTESERIDAPNRLPAARAFRVRELSLLEGALTGAPQAGAPNDDALDEEAMRAMLARIPTLPVLYTAMLENAAGAFAEVAREVVSPADPDRPGVLVHCTAGKDRTGVATALLLDAAGTERSAIVADYAASEQNLAGEWAERMLARARTWGVPLVPAITDLVTATPPSAIEAALAWLDDRGGSASYLLRGGLTPVELDRLRERIAG
ncbi:tyrosine-protein phosphatase [Microbacterium sp. NPDC089698]|uniref:tyrosine-protein phosphatase n=1 Tax=Microbacterium sp. NPDC089698 TaxID=3364200 RepID=UPI003822CAAE